MITCPNCGRANPEDTTQCEACYTPLPALINCPHCGTLVAATAEFCGQCGSVLLQPASSVSSPKATPVGVTLDPAVAPPVEAELPSTVLSSPPPQSPTPSLPALVTASTQLQQQVAKLIHVQSNTVCDLPSHLDVIHIGKPNEHIPPDIDVSGFSDAAIVSRVHADIRVEGDSYYIEDVGSANGTYINNLPLRPGDRHRLRPGDRVALGKGDKVSFIFQLT